MRRATVLIAHLYMTSRRVSARYLLSSFSRGAKTPALRIGGLWPSRIELMIRRAGSSATSGACRKCARVVPNGPPVVFEGMAVTSARSSVRERGAKHACHAVVSSGAHAREGRAHALRSFWTQSVARRSTRATSRAWASAHARHSRVTTRKPSTSYAMWEEGCQARTACPSRVTGAQEESPPPGESWRGPMSGGGPTTCSGCHVGGPGGVSLRCQYEGVPSEDITRSSALGVQVHEVQFTGPSKSRHLDRDRVPSVVRAYSRHSVAGSWASLVIPRASKCVPRGCHAREVGRKDGSLREISAGPGGAWGGSCASRLRLTAGSSQTSMRLEGLAPCPTHATAT
mmetsp:Transcript_32542/g.83176  ORF Transcript_32542/g.83176 Transcript_32542/m.83176 type:complete len:342 (-) Transcript_32542:3183-4208(-)